MFSVRIVTADYYTASPIKDLDVCYSEFRESVVKKVPVVRIFGATPGGKYVHWIFNEGWPLLHVLQHNHAVPWLTDSWASHIKQTTLFS